MLVLLLVLYVMTIIGGAVLDPALYLLPSPPLITNDDPGVRWTQPTRVTRDADTHRTMDAVDTTSTSTEDSESMESSETFWAGLRPSSYGLGGIHIPMTFSVSGTYGRDGYGSGVVGSGYSNYGSGVASGYGSGVASSYASLSAGPAKTFGSYGKSALAGSSYGTYGSGYPGVRLFGSSDRTGWSGWGNGKWGHYGKG